VLRRILTPFIIATTATTIVFIITTTTVVVIHKHREHLTVWLERTAPREN